MCARAPEPATLLCPLFCCAGVRGLHRRGPPAAASTAAARRAARRRPARRPASQQLDARALQLKEEGKTREALFQDEMTQQMETLMELQSKLDDDMGDLKVTSDINFTMNTLAAAFEKGGD